MTASPSPIVSLRDVTKRFPGVLANDRVSLDFFPGEVHALLGENGAGKSTLISMLAGVQRPDEGEIAVSGAAVAIASPKHALSLGIGTVYQHRMLVPTLTVAENLMLGAPWWRRPALGGIRARFGEAAAAFGVSVDPDARVENLSLGEQQQVEIIRALWRGGRLLVLDEPTAMLSPRGVEELGAMMKRMTALGIGIVFITHHLTEALEFGDRVSVLRSGRSVGGIGPEALKTLPRPEAMAEVVRLMFGTGLATAEAAEGEAHVPRVLLATKMLEVVGLSGRSPRSGSSFEDVSFHVRKGEIFGIAGVDGNGQTPLAEALAGQISATGSVVLEGRELGPASVAQRYQLGLRYATDDRNGEGMVGKLPISTNMVLKEIGAAPFWRRGIERRAAIDAHARALFVAHDVRAPGIHTPVGRLSGGNIQKVLLARELSGNPKVIVYSKPTHGLDLRNIEATRRRIRETAEAGVASVLISTDLGEVLALSDRIGVMVRGRLVGIVENGPEARRDVGRLMAGITEQEAA
ncbi:putative B6 ABC transporter ATP-binding protein [Frigidibacter mobilis]|uniref:ABC transporter n=1 Tax=Frigidibacter mobilis TaxID=1335048 RepID=A0A161GWZ9_9RHOB|nr:ABC transporter ATP-binding protein [Frigidibacter mobilis]AMY70479.1 ABC transporter [Frigidibacter mobilis]